MEWESIAISWTQGNRLLKGDEQRTEHATD
jgi:hypothetical protein